MAPDRLCGAPPRRILDLGAGTGLLSRWLRAAYPEGSSRSSTRPRELLGDDGVRYIRADMTADLPDGPWDAVVSALAVHHLSDEDKRRLFARTREALRPGSVFVNAEQVAGSGAFFDTAYREWHEAEAGAAGSDDDEWSAALVRMCCDDCASVEDQLRWLREAGFAEADCLFKEYRFAVIVAR